jgi:hypothetical protein
MGKKGPVRVQMLLEEQFFAQGFGVELDFACGSLSMS